MSSRQKHGKTCVETGKIILSEAQATRKTEHYEEINNYYYCEYCEGYHLTSLTNGSKLGVIQDKLFAEGILVSRKRIHDLLKEFKNFEMSITNKIKYVLYHFDEFLDHITTFGKKTYEPLAQIDIPNTDYKKYLITSPTPYRVHVEAIKQSFSEMKKSLNYQLSFSTVERKCIISGFKNISHHEFCQLLIYLKYLNTVTYFGVYRLPTVSIVFCPDISSYNNLIGITSTRDNCFYDLEQHQDAMSVLEELPFPDRHELIFLSDRFEDLIKKHEMKIE